MPPAKKEATVTFDFKKISIILGVVLTLFGATYSVYTFGSTYHTKYATKTELSAQINNVQMEILQVAIMSYEDELMSLNFKISTGQANDLDSATKENIERRLVDLKAKLNNL